MADSLTPAMAMPAEDSSSHSAPRRSRRSSLSSIRSRRISQAHISLIDRTETLLGDESLDDVPSPVPSHLVVSKTSTRTRTAALLDPNHRGKYGRYSEERARPVIKKKPKKSEAPDAQLEDDAELHLVDSNWGQSTLERGRQHLHAKLRPKKQKRKANGVDYEIDVLYENQRGTFVFGIPMFSANALSQFEPAPWVDANFKESRVNITDAQLPDPSWEWSWRTWYVDMSRDVDEEGWEYSFYFKGFSWHGTHPWLTSFVRRRRWIRKRVRKQSHRRPLVERRLGDAHMMNNDYFTIHANQLRLTPSGGLASPVTEESSGPSKPWGEHDLEAWEAQEIPDIGTLIRALKEAPVDSERITLIRRFLDQGGEDLYYLADEVSTPSILFCFGTISELKKLINRPRCLQ
jgi:hypothetical protein